jgi:predicted nucleotidyltransferase
MNSVDERTKRLIIAVISAIIPEAKIILFGSRARSDFSPRSDIDVAIDAGKVIDIRLMGEARDMIDASNISLGIDIVDVHAISKSMAENIRKEGIIWKS